MLTGAALVAFELVEGSVVGSLFNAPPGMASEGYFGLWLQPVYVVVGALLVLGAGEWRRRRHGAQLG